MIEKISYLEDAIKRRAIRRKLTVDLEKMAYVDQWIFSHTKSRCRNALYVGVGHGHDALYALLEGNVDRVVGVDPYVESDGSDEQDYDELKELIERYDLHDRFKVYKTTIQDYLVHSEEMFDHVFFIDVLHHIFTTKSRLGKSKYFAQAIELFRAIWKRTDHGGRLIAVEVERYGLRQLLVRMGFVEGFIDYSTKQPWYEWTAAMTRANFSYVDKSIYIPWALRGLKKLCDNHIGLYTVSDKSIIMCNKE
jgi:SAM-dependent methyltransferase